jgi:uncharacterized OB-fold protein
MSTTGTTADPLTGPFWSAVERQELVRPYCPVCERSFFVPQIVCPTCQQAVWTYEQSSGRGVVYSHTTVHRAPVEGFVTPYVLAVIDMEEGWSMMSNVVGVEPDAVAIGQDVAVTWVETAGRALPAFTPVQR